MTVIKNGLVVDGTGAIAFAADIVIDGDKIADVVKHGSLTPSYEGIETFDASGLIVTPGFIDVHSHSDTYLLIEPDAPSKISQGITTEINGQCGGSAAPRYGEARLSSDWASMDYPTLPDENDKSTIVKGPSWRSMAQYRELFDSVRPAINTVQFVGHNTLRSSVIGYDALSATEETLTEMSKLLARELDDGGWGLTTGLIYQPGKYSSPEEVVALAKVAASKGGFYATHMRSEGDNIIEAIDEVLSLVRATSIRAEISHIKTSGKKNWNKIDSVISKIDNAVQSGELLGADRYPYCAAGTDLDVVLPDWAGEGGLVKELERLNDPTTRKKIILELDSSSRDWSAVQIGGTWAKSTQEFSGRMISEILLEDKAFKNSPGLLVTEILIRDEGRTGAFFFGMSEDNLHKIYSRPWVLAGSDASLRAPWGVLGKDHPHPRAYGTMPEFFRRLTGRTSGYGAVASREEAISRMTFKAANRFGIKNRGVIAKGAYADIAIWNENEFASQSTYLKPHAFAKGMKAVFVNGTLSYKENMFSSSYSMKRNGRFLER
jgi:N-acyl-D-amino-acid deacylase